MLGIEPKGDIGQTAARKKRRKRDFAKMKKKTKQANGGAEPRVVCRRCCDGKRETIAYGSKEVGVDMWSRGRTHEHASGLMVE